MMAINLYISHDSVYTRGQWFPISVKSHTPYEPLH